MPRRVIEDFLVAHTEVKILEELDDTLEKAIKALAYDLRLNTKIIGKVAVEDWIGEYTPDKVREILHRTWPTVIDRFETEENDAVTVPPRPAQMCPRLRSSQRISRHQTSPGEDSQYHRGRYRLPHPWF